jgi:two-component system response regulator BaeR
MSAAPHVLVVEDEAKLAAALCEYLAASGFRTSTLDHGGAVADFVRMQAPSAVLLDLGLPGLDGLSVCKALRAFSQVPVIMLTARVEEVDRLLGLELGADDYVCKPFSVREVVARLRAVLRRSAGTEATAAERRIVLDGERFEVRVGAKAFAVTPVEFRMLRLLMERPGRVYSRPQMMAVLYDDHRIVADRTVDSHVRNLRRKFADLGVAPLESVYGVGFRFDPGAD